MSIITLTTDFGITDHRVAAIKGNLLTLDKQINIVDITHNIQPYNLLQTSYIVRNAYKHFPKNTVHIISIDSLYHSQKKLLLCFVNDQYFLVADNGLIHLIFFDIKPDAVYEININNRFDDEVKCSILDIFVPVAHHITRGGVPEIIGKKISITKELSLPKAQILENENMIAGEVIYIDHYGNVVSNITKAFFDSINIGNSAYTIKFRNINIKKIQSHQTDFITNYEQESKYQGKQFAVFNDAGYLEICIYKGNEKNGAKTLLGLDVGENIYIEFQN